MATFGSATLVLKGPKGSTTVEVSGARVSVGRDPGSDSLVTDPAVSNSQFELVKEDGALVIRDLGSSNGTYVNGKRIQSVRLYDGDVVQIGQSQGGIAVRQTNGQPLQPPSEGSGMSAVLWVLAIVFLGGAGAIGWLIVQGAKEKQELAAFEKDAVTALQSPSPCDVARQPIASLGNGRDLVVPSVAKAQKLEDDELSTHRALLQKTRKIEQTVSSLVTQLDSRATDSNARTVNLIQWKDEVGDVFMAQQVDQLKAVQAALNTQLEDAVKLKIGLDGYAKAMSRFNESLAHAISIGERTPGDLEAPPNPKQAADLVNACDDAFSKTSSTAYASLAAVPL